MIKRIISGLLAAALIVAPLSVSAQSVDPVARGMAASALTQLRGLSSTFTGGLGTHELTQAPAASGALWEADVSAFDPLSAPIQATINNGTGANLPSDPRPDIVYRLGQNIDQASKPTEAGQWLAWESRFVQAGCTGMEFHYNIRGTDGVTHRPLAVFSPVDAVTACSSTELSGNVVSFQNYGGTPLMELNFSTKHIDISQSMLFEYNNNNVYNQQINAAGNAFLALPGIDASNRLKISEPIFAQAQAADSVTGQAFQFQALAMTDGQVGMGLSVPTKSGSSFTIIGHNVIGSIQGELDDYVWNTGAGFANYMARTSNAQTTAVPQFIWDINGGSASWAACNDRRDSYAWKLGKSTDCANNVAIRVDTSLNTKLGGHLGNLGSAPAITSCGTSPTVVGSDTAGEVTTGTATPTACTITFAAAYTAQPYCVVADRSALANLTSYTVSTTAIVLTTTAASSQKITYVCQGA